MTMTTTPDDNVERKIRNKKEWRKHPGDGDKHNGKKTENKTMTKTK